MKNQQTQLIPLAIVLVLILVGIIYFVATQHSHPTSTTTSQGTSTTTTASGKTPVLSSTTSSAAKRTVSGSGNSGSIYAGMSQYTDTNFGFSFWYPSSWRVAVVGGGGETYGAGVVERKLVIGDGTQAHEIVLDEVYSSSESITGGNPAKSDLYETYFFDPSTHLWMYTATPVPPDTRSIGTTTADVAYNNMGGLHEFTFQGTFGESVAIPLSGVTYVISEVGGLTDPRPLIETITATDSSVATPENVVDQKAVIQIEEHDYTGT